ncbi:Uncharacterised protein [Mycobacteroides abscessus subsp. abscessus]|uniref:Uncharacterized protein n=1 Tax=Mycobacteroides abscessus subsp. abscessus TaxID=1185650 RepID=A0AB74FJ85_9MYCO|nr:hypothetical protein AOY11_06085 [Mycobacteroides abscessus]EPZ18293.1 hypothetical protein M879_22290 [Mycobacteroides abscessus V06705]OLT71781.1 hypothetical protein BKG55_11830 [Mycobacteroides abscessus ATCC 19977]SHP43044.1 Uncharacterised protein [Mycobacteroides abscessus subsp. abscessus]AMU44964.1 hypothetical protein A3O00_06710 [Mycobacteroides abscessus]
MQAGLGSGDVSDGGDFFQGLQHGGAAVLVQLADTGDVPRELTAGEQVGDGLLHGSGNGCAQCVAGIKDRLQQMRWYA